MNRGIGDGQMLPSRVNNRQGCAQDPTHNTPRTRNCVCHVSRSNRLLAFSSLARCERNDRIGAQVYGQQRAHLDVL